MASRPSPWNRPERLNAFDDLMLSEWLDAIERSDADRDVRAIILTGAGRGFCSGMDVSHEVGGEGILQTQDSVAARRHSLRNRVHPIPRALIQLEKPYIAAVNGAAVGAGMDMASMADIRFASERARFGMAYVRMGLIPGDGGAWSLPAHRGHREGPGADLERRADRRPGSAAHRLRDRRPTRPRSCWSARANLR